MSRIVALLRQLHAVPYETTRWLSRYGRSSGPLAPPAAVMGKILMNLWMTTGGIRLRLRRWHERKGIDRLGLRDAPQQFRVSFCIPCGNRLHHLRETLPRNLRDNAAAPKLEILILDYGSSDGLRGWLESTFPAELASGRIRCVRREASRFEMSRAKNEAHRAATGDIVCNLDADNFTGKDFALWISHVVAREGAVVGRGVRADWPLPLTELGLDGRIFLRRRDFEELGGYDERFSGWGPEDEDLFRRGKRLGLKPLPIPLIFLDGLTHSRTEADGIPPLDSEVRRKNTEILRSNDIAGVIRANL